MRLAALILLLWPALAWGQTVTLPAEVRGEPGTIVVVKAQTDCSSLQWLALDKGLSLIPPDLLRDSKTAVVMAGRPGKYRLLAYGAKGDVASPPAVATVVIGEPGPEPGPQPVPPDDPNVKTLQAAYDRETDADKAKHKAQLAALYRQAAGLVGGGSLSTWGELFQAIGTAAQSLGVSGKLPALQTAVRDAYLSGLPTERQRPLDDTGRKQAAEAFALAAKGLEGVK